MHLWVRRLLCTWPAQCWLVQGVHRRAGSPMASPRVSACGRCRSCGCLRGIGNSPPMQLLLGQLRKHWAGGRSEAGRASAGAGAPVRPKNSTGRASGGVPR